MKKISYIRCPRCELNFIQKKDKFCAVCKAEMSANKDNMLDELDLELCPICKTNYIQSDEVMCSACLKERGNDDDDLDSVKNEDEWNSYVEQDEDDFILDNEETGELAIIDLDDEDLDEDLGLVEDDFDEEDEDEDVSDDDDDFDDYDDDEFDYDDDDDL